MITEGRFSGGLRAVAKMTSGQRPPAGSSQIRTRDGKTGWSQISWASGNVPERRNDPEVGGRWLMGDRQWRGPWRQKLVEGGLGLGVDR